jgi:hypothetical protein
MTYYLHNAYFLCQTPTFCDDKVRPGSGSTWTRIGLAFWIRIRIEVKSWIRIRIRIETNADMKHCLYRVQLTFDIYGIVRRVGITGTHLATGTYSELYYFDF